MKVKSESEVTQSYLTLSDPMDSSPPGSSVHGIFQARVLEWGAISFSVPRSKRLLISWLRSPSAVILEPRKIKSDTVSTVSPSIPTHLMVSRQETARPLLTPGEVMQLPPDDAVVMVSGHAPIRAKKLRYYVDANFKRRVLSPPVLANGPFVDVPTRRADDWSALPIPVMPSVPVATITLPEGVTDDGGLRRQPELADEMIYAPTSDGGADDLAMLDDDDLPLPVTARLDSRLQRTARLATLDPADGIPL